MKQETPEINVVDAHLVTQKKQPRKKTARACVNCHKAHMTCDASRPCKRCVNKGLESTCTDAPRKLKKYLLLDSNNNPSTGPLPNTATPIQPSTLFNNPLNLPPSQPNLHNVVDMHQQNQHNLINPGPRQPQPQPQPHQPHHSTIFNDTRNKPYEESIRHSINNNLLPHNSHNASNTNMGMNPLDQARQKSKFMSNAINNEYSSLSEIIKQDDLNRLSPYPQSTVSPPNLLDSFKTNNRASSLSDTPTPTSSMNNAHDIYTSFKEGDRSINQYMLGYVQDHIITLPETLSIIEGERAINGEPNQDQGGDKALSFTIHLNENNAQENQSLSESGLRFKEAEDIYSKINKPFSYTPGFHALNQYLKRRFSKPDLVRMAKSMAVYRPSFIACTNTLKEEDLIFMEQCFQRTLLEYDKFISISGTPTIVWRRTGQIAYVSEEFCIMTGWTREQLLSKMTFIVELMDNISVIEYFDLFSTIAYGDFRGATMTGCTLLTPNNTTVKTTCIWTLKRDVFGIPMMIIGNFLPIF